MKLVTSIDIKAPIDKTYAVFADIANADKNIAAIEKIELVNQTNNFVGTRWRETRTEFGKRETIEMWVSEADPNNYYEVESEAHGAKYWSRYDFEALDSESTRVTLTFTGEPKTFGAKVASLMMVFFAGATKKMFLKDMQDLKKVLEA